jgi:hypothetical protein
VCVVKKLKYLESFFISLNSLVVFLSKMMRHSLSNPSLEERWIKFETFIGIVERQLILAHLDVRNGTVGIVDSILGVTLDGIRVGTNC